MAQVELPQPGQLGEGGRQRGELVAGQTQHLRDTNVHPAAPAPLASAGSYLQLGAGSQFFRKLRQAVSAGKQNSELLEPSDLRGQAAQLQPTGATSPQEL